MNEAENPPSDALISALFPPMHDTLELPLKIAEPAVSPEQVQQLVAVLARADEYRQQLPPTRRPMPAGWMTAVELASLMGEDTTDREVRAIASAACPAVVSFPGSPGYKLWQLCSIEEIDNCIESMERQANEMLKRSIMYRRAYHRRFRGVQAGLENSQRAINLPT